MTGCTSFAVVEPSKSGLQRIAADQPLYDPRPSVERACGGRGRRDDASARNGLASAPDEVGGRVLVTSPNQVFWNLTTSRSCGDPIRGNCEDRRSSLETDSYFIMRIRDPDRNLVVLASARRS